MAAGGAAHSAGDRGSLSGQLQSGFRKKSPKPPVRTLPKRPEGRIIEKM